MTVHVEPPTTYKHWTGRAVRHPDADRLDASWHHPTMIYDGDTLTESWTPALHDDWVHLGWAPRALTRWGRFWTSWHHGRLMGYPRLSVLVFAARSLTRTLPNKEHTP